MNTITQKRLKKYFQLTSEALTEAKASLENPSFDGARADFLDMIERYLSDADYFAKKGDVVTAFAALNYAHGWLDAGARIGLFEVHNSRLFTVDDKD